MSTPDTQQPIEDSGPPTPDPAGIPDPDRADDAGNLSAADDDRPASAPATGESDSATSEPIPSTSDSTPAKSQPTPAASEPIPAASASEPCDCDSDAGVCDAVPSDSEPASSVCTDDGSGCGDDATVSEAQTGEADSESDESAGRSSTAELSLPELQRELSEKEQLVEELTERLEQAADQLDRLRRTVGEHGLVVSGGIPQHVIAAQEELLEALHEVLNRWAQPGDSPWDRLAARLDEIDQHLSEQISAVAGFARVAERSSSEPAAAESLFAEESPDKTTPGETAPADADATSTARHAIVLSSAALNASGATEHTIAESHLSTNAERSGQETAEESGMLLQTPDPVSALDHVTRLIAQAVGDVPPCDSPLPRTEVESIVLPDPVDDDESNPEVLRNAVRERDSCIGVLLHQLRLALQAGTACVPGLADANLDCDQPVLPGATEEQQAQIVELQYRLQQTLRAAEIETSLQRAKLAREEARLQQLIEEQKRSAPRDNDSADVPRWLRFLSVAKHRRQ